MNVDHNTVSYSNEKKSFIQLCQNNFNELILNNILNAVHCYNNREHNKRCSAQNIVIDSNLNRLRFCCVKNINN